MVDIDDFEDIVGRHFRQPKEGLGLDNLRLPTEQLYQEIAPTFVEGRVMVEAHQARLSEFGEEGLIDIASDATRMQMRRMVDRLIAGERIALAAE